MNYFTRMDTYGTDRVVYPVSDSRTIISMAQRQLDRLWEEVAEGITNKDTEGIYMVDIVLCATEAARPGHCVISGYADVNWAIFQPEMSGELKRSIVNEANELIAATRVDVASLQLEHEHRTGHTLTVDAEFPEFRTDNLITAAKYFNAVIAEIHAGNENGVWRTRYWVKATQVSEMVRAYSVTPRRLDWQEWSDTDAIRAIKHEADKAADYKQIRATDNRDRTTDQLIEDAHEHAIIASERLADNDPEAAIAAAAIAQAFAATAVARIQHAGNVAINF